jgi:uncharacterized protein YjbI with pentapeptide repeats
MKPAHLVLLAIGFVLLAQAIKPLNCFGDETKPECKGKFKGRKPTDAELNEVLKEHKAWWTDYHNRTGMMMGDWAIFQLPNVANDPRRANLCGADLQDAKILDHANLAGADLAGAFLGGTNLSSTDLEFAFLPGAFLYRAKLAGAHLSFADLRGAFLSSANLAHADLIDVDLAGAYLGPASLGPIDLTYYSQIGANSAPANLSGANLTNGNLSGADLTATNLSGANLTNGNLSGANLTAAQVTKTKLAHTVLTDVIYAPESQPPDPFVAGIKGLATMRGGAGEQTGMVQLRKLFEDAGLRDNAREATSSIQRNITNDQLSTHFPHPAWIDGILRTVGFEWTTAYGLHPERALRWMLALAAVLTPAYMSAIRRPTAESGIIRVFPAGRFDGTAGDPADEEKPKKQLVRAQRWGEALSTAAYFSLLSAVNFGFEQFTPGDWIRRLQNPRIFP